MQQRPGTGDYTIDGGRTDSDRLARQASVMATATAHGGDPAIGPRLPAHLRAAGLLDVQEHTVVNPMTTTHDKLFLAQLLDNMRTAVLQTGSATGDDLAGIRGGIVDAAEDDATVFFQARMHQVSGRRP